MGSWGRKDTWQASGWRTGWARWWFVELVVLHSHMDKPEQLRSETDHPTQGSSGGNKVSKPLAVKTCGNWGSRINSQSHKRVHWRDPLGPRMYRAHTSWNQNQKDPICLWEGRKVTESRPRAEQAALFPFGPLPHI